MSVTNLAVRRPDVAPSDFTPAIRTPDQFKAAHDRVSALLHDMTAGGLADAAAVVEEVQTLRQAMDDSPFCMLGQDVVARGFTARVISRLD